MKRIVTFLLAGALALALTACDSRDYSADFTGLFNVSSFRMTQADAIALEDGERYETSTLSDSTLLKFENGNIYRFSKDGRLEFVKYTRPENIPGFGMETWEAIVTITMETWTEKFGEPEYSDKISSYLWYGNVDGEKASLVILKNDGKLSSSMMSLERVQ